MGDFLRAEIAAGRTYLPAGANVLRAFQQPFDDVRVLIVGQDPYPTPGMAIGLSFAVSPEVRSLPGSLENIFRELHTDLGLPRPSNGDLTPWTEQGVLLLNRALTTAPRKPAAHRGKGWEAVTEQAIRCTGGPRYAAGAGVVGQGRPQSAAAARGSSCDRVRPPVPDVGGPWILWFAAVQQDQRPARQAGCSAGRMAPAVAHGRRNGRVTLEHCHPLSPPPGCVDPPGPSS